ncbi:hypothetical protein [uncultured Pontibacter sp.]|uniref:hypothetical protein n=1 Tax=uncultured Pontibacter sp. TaxID=453356 RepID=UPI002613285C|nr:hypothetical protein [uncultured Pontibacter sp.]
MPEAKVILFREPQLTICIEPNNRVIVVQANGEVPSAMYREGMELATEQAIERRLKYWLVNNKAGGIITPQDQIWANEVMIPQLAYKSEIVKMALIEPADTLSQLILEGMMDKARDITPFEMQFFEKLEDAYVWFEEHEDSPGL